ncbi:exonuclease domain-containing protein [Conexibacter sp. DBS9H8]|uniref:exonuclease domain-containing protein n=1 Tax=Conexibacter sp. DBS9H8 TaxID=2937801 RepID=UPI00200D603E|nr:exonuclease domain-containing protein [Conexibacter sp. DBS9H8]
MRAPSRRTPAVARYRQHGRPQMRTPWNEAEWCAVDLELTGLDPGADQIVAAGLVVVSGGRVQLGLARYSLVATSRRSSVAALLTHRVRAEELVGAPTLDEVMEMVIDTLAGRVPIVHHASVERSFLAPPLARRGVRMPPVADTERLGHRWLARSRGDGPPALSLPALAAALGQTAEPAHHALADAISTAAAFIALATLWGGHGRPPTVGELLDASADPHAERTGR